MTDGLILTQADIAILLSESTKTVARHIKELENHGHIVPTRGSWKDIGSGVSHKKRILELYLKGNEYTEIERKTKHSGEAIMRYVIDFARVLVLTEEEYSVPELSIVTGLSERVIREYQELIEQYSGHEYRERLEHLRAIFKKKGDDRRTLGAMGLRQLREVVSMNVPAMIEAKVANSLPENAVKSPMVAAVTLTTLGS